MPLLEKPQVMKVMELIGVHDGKVVARMVVHAHPREPRIPAILSVPSYQNAIQNVITKCDLMNSDTLTKST